MELKCNQADHFTPCACTPVITTADIHTDDGKLVQVEFPEFKCADKINHERADQGRVSKGYTCAQLTAKRWLYRNVNGEPIEPVYVKYNAGCELRCVNKGCKQ